MNRVGSSLLLIVLSTLLFSSCAAIESESQETGKTKRIATPNPPENSDHGYLLADSRIPRLESCQEWEGFWNLEGPAVSFIAASQYSAEEIAVSTQIYLKNRHLDTDRDGVLCFFENEAKPSSQETRENSSANAESDQVSVKREPWMLAAIDVRESMGTDQNEPHPIDFASSPNVVPSHANTVRRGVDFALRTWAPFIESNRPLAMTVVHPDDKRWFLKRWEALGRDNTGSFWWDLAKANGGGAVGTTEAGIPNMYFMTSESYVPPDGPVDYYVHEVAHFFQALTAGANKRDSFPCWYFEGTATFVGFSMTYPDDEDRTIAEFAFSRIERAKVLMEFYGANGGLTEKRLSRDVLNFPEGDPTCQHEFPQFGYNLGMFVTEKFIIDFGFDAFVEMTKEMGKANLPKAFNLVTKVDYIGWVEGELLPYLSQTLAKEAIK